MDPGIKYLYSIGLSFIIGAFLSAMLAFVIEKKEWM